MPNGREGREFLELLSESERQWAIEIIDQPLDVGYREIAGKILMLWPLETRQVWGIWVGYPKGVGMDLVEAVQPGQAYA